MAPTSHFSITSIGTDAASIALSGDVDAATAAEVSERLGPLAAAHAHLEVDLSAVTFLDSDGAGPLIAAASKAHARGDQLVITGRSAAAERLRDALEMIPRSTESA